MSSMISSVIGHLTDLIERAEKLDVVARPLHRIIPKLIPRGQVNGTLSGTGLGHPLHPTVVQLPLGAWFSVVVLDLVGGSRSRSAATRLLGIGNLAALPAVAAGVNDWMDTNGAESRVGLIHATGNAGALTLFTASWWARVKGKHRAGIALGLAGLTLSGAAGWLGGHLGYAMGVGVDTTAFEPAVDDWTEVGTEDNLRDNEPLMVRANRTPVLLVRNEGTIYALADRCTHRGAPLHEGTVAAGCITCPWHGSQFRLTDGAIAHGPATRPQPCMEVRVTDGQIEVRQPGSPRDDASITGGSPSDDASVISAGQPAARAPRKILRRTASPTSGSRASSLGLPAASRLG